MGTPLTLRLAESLGPSLLRLLGSSLRVKILPEGIEERLRASGQRAIFAFWHGRMLIPAFTHRFRNIAILVSEHRDGEYIARVVARLGFVPVRGSTTRGGVKALKAAIERSRTGFDLAFTPDGPRGPRYVVQRGVVFAASRTGLPVIPCAVEAVPAWVLGSWDEFTIPKPFSRALILFGDPMCVPAGVDVGELARYRDELQAEMRRLMGEARRWLRETSGRAGR